MTATPVSNGVFNFKGFIPFLQNRYTEDLRSNEHPIPLGLDD